MIKKHKQKVGTVGANPCVRPFILILFLLSFLIVGQAQGEGGQGYDSLLTTMQARQSRLEELLQSPEHCLGEGLDGLLTINASCSAEARDLAEAENWDREKLHKLMAEQLDISEEKVGEERAKKYVNNYVQGILREVRISARETTWWDGYPPDPRKTALSRVLTKKGAMLYAQPNTYSSVVRDNVQQYEAFGVLGSTEDSSGERWYQVTEEYVPKIKPHNWSANPIGWIAESKVIPWRWAVAMRFTNPYNREPSLFFDSPQPALNLIQAESDIRRQNLRTLRNQIENGQGYASGVVAVEPHVGAGQERMIMYPVLDFHTSGGKNDLFIDGKFARLLQVAARTRDGASESRNDAVAIDIIFVMDTTHSMQPYLEDVLAATEQFAKAHTDDGLHFGFIGYQDKDPQFSYLTREFTSRTLPASEFVHALTQVKARESPVKGDDIHEAVFEGVNTALDSNQWRQGAIKIIFLLGDAPGRNEELNTKILHDKALTRKIRLFAFHLRNSSISKKLDKVSKKQYAELSSYSEGIQGETQEQSYWHSIDASAVQFRQIISKQFMEAQSTLDAIRNINGDTSPEIAAGSLNELIFQQATLLYADKTLPEQDITGWVCDKVLTNPDREALVPMILLTETELEELTARVRELKEIGERALRGDGGTTLNFFDLVSQNTKFTMVDPAAVTFRDTFSVPLGIGELPYKSDIMAKERSDFDNSDRVGEFISKMNNKLLHYEDLMRKRGDTTVWKKLSAGAENKDIVVGVELNQLP